MGHPVPNFSVMRLPEYRRARNARIVGSQIKAAAWELLIVMLVMESAFGLAGFVAAPIYYAFIKNELLAKELI